MAPRKKIEQTLFTTWNRDPEHLGPWLDEEAVAALLSLSEDEVEQLRQNWKLIAVAGADGSWRYPERQFPNGATVDGWEAVIKRLATRMGPETIAAVMAADIEPGRTHWEMLGDTDPDTTLAWAEQTVAGYHHAIPEQY